MTSELKWMRKAAQRLVEANLDRGKTYDNQPNVEETIEIIASEYSKSGEHGYKLPSVESNSITVSSQTGNGEGSQRTCNPQSTLQVPSPETPDSKSGERCPTQEDVTSAYNEGITKGYQIAKSGDAPAKPSESCDCLTYWTTHHPECPTRLGDAPAGTTPERGDPVVGRTVDEERRPLVCFVCARRFAITYNFCSEHKDEYERLKTDAARASSAPPDGWVSVEERLPEVWQQVWVHGGVAAWDGVRWVTYMDTNNPVISWEVTHWLPLSALPSPPAGQGSK